jgi:hypothetical protein
MTPGDVVLLQVLAQAIALRDGDFRMNSLLADFENGNGFAKGWRMAVGECFRDSLDIKSLKSLTQTDEATDDATSEIAGKKEKDVTLWTQGGTFSFSQGDIIYDMPRAYQRWDVALESVRIAYQISKATPSRPRKETTFLKKNTSFAGSLAGGQIARRQEVVRAIPPEWMEEREVIETVEESTGTRPSSALLQTLCDIGAIDRRVDVESRFPGVVHFRVLAPNADKSRLCIKEEKAVSQDDFVALLITGIETKHNTAHSSTPHPRLRKH